MLFPQSRQGGSRSRDTSRVMTTCQIGVFKYVGTHHPKVVPDTYVKSIFFKKSGTHPQISIGYLSNILLSVKIGTPTRGFLEDYPTLM